MLNIEDLLAELLRFDRKTNDKVKVDKMTHIVAETILAMGCVQNTQEVILQMMEMEPEGHA